MKKHFAVALLLFTTAVYAGSTKIGVVLPDVIFKESKVAQLAGKKINDEFSVRRSSIQSQIETIKQKASLLERDGPTLSQQQKLEKQKEISDLDQLIQKSQRELASDLESRRRTDSQNVLELINKVVKRIAKQENYDLILQNVVYASPAFDLTKRVISEMDKETPQ
jgi:outer membrane protein